MEDSASKPTNEISWTPAARVATSCSSAVLPIPGSPRISIDPLIPLRALLISPARTR